MRRSTTRAVSCLVVATSLSACVAEPASQSATGEEEIELVEFNSESDGGAEVQSLALNAESEAIDPASVAAWIKVAAAVYGILEKFISDPPTSREEYEAMLQKLLGLQSQIEIILANVKNLKVYIDNVALESRLRDVNTQLAILRSAQEQALARLESAEDKSEEAWTVANVLRDPSYYNFATFEQGFVFTPWLGSAAFLDAVTSWLALRQTAALSDSARAADNATTDLKLQEFANHFNWIADNLANNISCSRSEQPNSKPCPPNPGQTRDCEVPDGCHVVISCFDKGTLQNTIVDEYDEAPTCKAGTSAEPGRARPFAESLYGLSKFGEVAQQWRTLAAVPNTNYARGKPAFQSPDSSVGPAFNAVDGVRNGAFDNGSVTHTEFGEQAWWWVDLGSLHNIGNVRLFNRTDCCQERLSHYQIFVSSDSTDGWDGNWAVVADGSGVDISSASSRMFGHPMDVSARWVAVTTLDPGFLSLAEVEVLGN